MLTTEEIAKELKVSNECVRTWIRQRKLKAYKVNRLWRVKPEDLENFIKEV